MISTSISLNTTSDAPRLCASRPYAPVPANKSRTLDCFTSLAMTLKTFSRTRSVVGRVIIPLRDEGVAPLGDGVGIINFLPRCLPAIILTLHHT